MDSVQHKFKRKMIIGTLSRGDGNERQCRALMKKIIFSILKFIRLEERDPIPAKPCYVHLGHVIKLYEDWKSVSSSYTVYVYKHFGKQTVRYLLKLCHYWWIHDPHILTKVMTYYEECFGEYTQILYGVVDCRATWKTLFQKRKWLKPVVSCNKHKNASPLLYFLENYNFISQKENGKYFVDLPAPFLFHTSEYYTASALCCQWGHPRKFLLLLQYGASISGFYDNETEAYRYLDMLHLTIDIVSIFCEYNNYGVINRESVGLATNFRRRLQCCILLIRAAPQMPLESDIDVRVIIEKAKRLKNAGYEIDVKSRLTDPCPLKHLCRLVIRSILKYSGRLPQGLAALPVTQCLKDYLNLLQD